MNQEVINLADKFHKITEHYTPKVVAQMNNYHFKLAKIQGEFVWHSHADTDEMFMVVEGELEIALRDKLITLKKGEMYVVPAGVEHKPNAKEECQIMLIEPAGTVNTGDQGGDMTKPHDEWI